MARSTQSREARTRSTASNTKNKDTKMSDSQSAAPGAEVEAKDKKPTKELYHQLLPVDDDGNPTGQLTSLPEDFDRTKHIPLRRKDFKDGALYFDWRAQLAEEQATKFREQAKEERALGSVQDRAKAKRLKSLHEKMAQLEAELSAAGVDIDAIKGGSES